MKLFKFQEEVIQWAVTKKRCGIFLDMGLGKTVIGCNLINELGKTALIICPKNALGSWYNHIKKINIDYNLLVLNQGSEKNIKTLLNLKEKIDIYLITISQLYGIFDYIRNLNFDVLIFDESHSYRNFTKRTRNSLILAKKAKYLFLLTGTPVGNKKYIDYYFQLKMLNKINMNKFEFESRYGRFVERYNFAQNRKWRELIGFQNTEELDEIVNECCVRLMSEKKDKTFRIMFKKPKRYAEFYKKRILKFKSGGEMVSETASKLYYHLRLLSSGFAVDNNGKPRIISYAKINWLINFLAERENDRVVIWFTFKIENLILLKLIQNLNRPYAIVDGATKDLSKWDEENAICLAQYQAASIGMNDLITSNQAVYFSPPNSIIDYRQARKRIDRISQIKQPYHYELCAEKTIDDKIYDCLDSGESFLLKDFTTIYEKF